MGNRDLKRKAVVIAPMQQDVLRISKSMDRQTLALYCEDQQVVMGSDRGIFMNKKLDAANRVNDFYFYTNQIPIKPASKRLQYN